MIAYLSHAQGTSVVEVAYPIADRDQYMEGAALTLTLELEMVQDHMRPP